MNKEKKKDFCGQYDGLLLVGHECFPIYAMGR